MRPEESLAKMIAMLKEKTGKTLDEWRHIIEGAGLEKHGEVVAFLKGDHGLTHGYANQIALNRKANPEGSESDPVEAMLKSRPETRPIYDAVMAKLQAFGSDVDVAPKKAYESVRRKKQFAILQPAAGRLDVGINLPGVAAGPRLEASGSFNAMLSHRVRVSSVDQVDDELVGWLRQAYDGA
ncbi:MAG TPA: DUF4287 domain-containing protein [Fimbriimonadaceae bacterium]|nr:DUF4287 domain-containing protein [Fimbriimonadaceae bacterium]